MKYYYREQCDLELKWINEKNIGPYCYCVVDCEVLNEDTSVREDKASH